MAAPPEVDPVLLSEIVYYGREKLYHHIQQLVLEAKRKKGATPVLAFWNAFSMMMEGSVADAIREFQRTQHRDVVLCTTLALIHAHKLSPTGDKEAVQKLDAKMREERKTCGEVGWYHASMFLWMIGRHDKAREYVGRILKTSPSNPDACTLYGWIDLTCGRDSLIKKSVEYFDKALDNRDTVAVPPDCYLGKARLFEMRKKLSGALDLINLAVVDYQNYLPALIEKCRLQLALNNWEQCYDTTQRILSKSPSCIAARQYQVLWTQCKEGKIQETAEQIGELIELVDRHEPRNHRLYCDLSRLFSRVSGGNQHILQQTNTLLDRARSIAPNLSDYVTEAGNQVMMRPKGSPTREAVRLYREAMKLDETSVSALTGIIWCQILDGELEDAAQQLDFLTELQASIGQSSELCYLRALLAEREGQPAEQVVEKLRETEKFHTDNAAKLQFGFDYFVKISPELTLRLVKFLMNYASEEGSATVRVLHSCEQLLAELSGKAPGLIEALFLTAKLWVLKGDASRAQQALAECVKLDTTYSPALLLTAELALKKGDVAQCKQHLEVALSYNFEVREKPYYHLLMARACVREENMRGAEEALITALSLPGVRKAGANAVPLSERAAVFLELSSLYKQSGRHTDAMKIVTEATSLFQGTSEEIRIKVSHADLMAATDVDGALALLRAVKAGDAYYINSREKMAEILMKQRRDHRMYIKCFQELTETLGTAHTFDLLGDAYITIKDPTSAIDCYQTALKKDPHNGRLASKVGKAMVRTHNFSRATAYYETALKLGKQTELRYDLAELHFKLRQYDKVQRVITAGLEEENGDDLQSLEQRVKYHLMMASVAEKDGVQPALDWLDRAKDEQAKLLRVLQKATDTQFDAQKQRQIAADICCRSAGLFTERQDNEAAVRAYQEALLFLENYEKALVSLAQLYLNVDNLEACQQHCVTLLRYFTTHEGAAMMMGEVQFRKLQYDAATFHFEQLLEQSPANFNALARLIDLMRRVGKLNDCKPYMDAAEKQHSVTVPAGFHICKGLFYRHSSNASEALKCFNLARRDKVWGERAIFEMIDICLFPDGETVAGGVLTSVESGERMDSDVMALRTAEKLLNEWQPTTAEQQVRRSVLRGQLKVKSKAKGLLDEAIEIFHDTMQPTGPHKQVVEYVPAIVGLIIAYMVLKQGPRARTQIKRISRRAWNFREAEDLERAWLLAVDSFIESNRFDEAAKMLSRIIQYNQSCSKAWEYRGFLNEKTNNFVDAAMNYENAWRFSNKSNPVIGYKLGFNYLKAQRYVDAVEVCNKVLETHPTYPRIRKDILEKARASIRC